MDHERVVTQLLLCQSQVFCHTLFKEYQPAALTGFVTAEPSLALRAGIGPVPRCRCDKPPAAGVRGRNHPVSGMASATGVAVIPLTKSRQPPVLVAEVIPLVG
jgi:hypothetical protein